MLTMTGRRGFTLIEIMVAITIMLIVGGAVFKLLVTTQRVARGQAERAALQSNVRTGSIVVLNDLRELNGVVGGTADQNDVLNLAPDAITYRGMRGVGFICEAPTATVIRIARNGYSAYRDPQAGRDGVYVFIEGDPDTQLDDSWLRLGVTSVTTTAACPGTAGPAITLTVPSTAALAGLAIGTPVRLFEVMELRLYQSEGRSWLGARSVSAGEAIQPVLGPLTDGNGFGLEYLDAGGAPTADPAAVKSIRVTMRGTTEGVVHTGAGEGSLIHAEEELVSQVALRNAIRP